MQDFLPCQRHNPLQAKRLTCPVRDTCSPVYWCINMIISFASFLFLRIWKKNIYRISQMICHHQLTHRDFYHNLDRKKDKQLDKLDEQTRLYWGLKWQVEPQKWIQPNNRPFYGSHFDQKRLVCVPFKWQRGQKWLLAHWKGSPPLNGMCPLHFYDTDLYLQVSF